MVVSVDILMMHLQELGINKPINVYPQNNSITLLLCLQNTNHPEFIFFSEIKILQSLHIVIDLLLCHPDYRSKGLGTYMIHKIELLACRLKPEQPILHLVGVRETIPIFKRWSFQPSHPERSSRLSFFNDPNISNLNEAHEIKGICVKMKKVITTHNALPHPKLMSPVILIALNNSFSECLRAQISMEKIKRRIKKEWEVGLNCYKKAWIEASPENAAESPQPIKISKLWLYDLLNEKQLPIAQRNAVIESYFRLRIIKNNLALYNSLQKAIYHLNDTRSNTP